jgi:hypothetical protein
MMEFIDFKKEATLLIDQIAEVRRLMDRQSRLEELATLEQQMNQPDFWSDQNNAKKISQRESF